MQHALLEHQQLYLPLLPQASQAGVSTMRNRRASAGPEVHQRPAALLREHERKVLVRRQPLQELRRHPAQMEPRNFPQPLPSAWRADYELWPGCEKLGGGAFAEVFLVRHRLSHRGFAVKMMNRPNFKNRGIECQVDSEIEAMRHAATLSRDMQDAETFVLRLLDVKEEGDYVYLLLEFCEQGDLLQKQGRLSERELKVLARQLMLGLQAVHQLGYIHRDIKPDNLLCTADGRLRIADFGWCCLQRDSPTSLAGTLLYMAPEVLSNAPQTVQADLWSAGATLYQMMTGKTLLQTNVEPGITKLSERDPHQATALRQQWLLEEIHQICPPSKESKPSHVSAVAWDLLRKMLAKDPAERVSIEQALDHEWLRLGQKDVRARMAAEQESSEGNSVLTSPLPSRRKDARSPQKDDKACGVEGSNGSTQDVMDVMPTPSKPRSSKPTMAYTPPVSPEVTPERTRQDPEEKENSRDPEVSPEHKMRLQSLQLKVENKWTSPKDHLSEKSAGSQTSKLESPSRGYDMKPHRKTIASQMPRWELKRWLENMPWSQLGEGHPNQIEQQTSVSKGQAQLFGVPEEGDSEPQSGGSSSVKVPLGQALPRSPFAETGDLLTTSAPASRFNLRGLATGIAGPRDTDKALELLTPRMEKPQVGSHPVGVNAPMPVPVPPMPMPGNARTGAKVHAAFCLSPPHLNRYQQGSPLRPRVFHAPAAARPAAPVQNAQVLTQTRPLPNQIAYAPGNGAALPLSTVWSCQSPPRLRGPVIQIAHWPQPVPDARMQSAMQ